MKKFLSMVLALAMAMSLVTFAAPAAGAKDFTDNSSIQYKEAVDVISAIQIMDGYNDASFGPTGTLTRGAAAKIICNMILGPTTASALPTNVAPYPDVPAGSTFAGYIAYCAEHNIISGYADGNFRPADSLSGYAFLKMLLCALGYDQEIEKYQGANWRVNVAKQALGIGLDDGLNGELDGSRIVTREEAALYAFNTLQADMVEYENKTSVAVNGATVTVGGNTYHTKTAQTQNTNAGNIDNGSNNQGFRIVQFAEEYFPNLERVPKKNNAFQGGQGKFGEPSTTWYWKGAKIDTYDEKIAWTYNGDVKVSQIYSDLKLTGTAEEAAVYVNQGNAPNFYIDIERGNGDKLFAKEDQKKAIRPNGTRAQTGGAPTYYPTFVAATAPGGPVTNAWTNLCDKVGDGTIIKVFYDDDNNEVVISVMSVYPGQVNAVKAATSEKDAYIVVDYKGNNTGVPAGGGAPNTANYPVVSYKANDYDEYETNEAFEEDDMVWFTFSESDNEIGEVHKMTSVEGKLDRRVHDSSLTLDGTKYDYGQEKGFDFEAPAGATATRDDAMTNNSSYVIYLDGAGYVLFVEEAEFAADQYALIERISVEQTSGGQALTSSLQANGTPSNPALSNDWNTNMVRLLMSNGVERTVDLDGSSNYVSGGQIKNEFLPGSIVRYVAQSDGTYKLYKVSGGASMARSTRASDAVPATAVAFSINSHTINGLYVVDSSTGNLVTAPNMITVDADSETTFVVQDDDTFKVYDGKRNSPNVPAGAAAYAYCTGSSTTTRTAKVIFVVRGTPESSSKEITFLAGKSRSDLYTSADTADYYEYTAMVNGTLETVLVASNVYDAKSSNNATAPTAYNNANLGNIAFSMNPADGDEAWNSIILNTTGFNSDDIMTKASFDKSGVNVYRTMGIKRANNSYEIKLGEYDGTYTAKAATATTPAIVIDAKKQTVDMASNCNIYYVDGDGMITQISYNDIHNDTDDVIFYTYDNDDAEITNLFICDFEP